LTLVNELLHVMSTFYARSAIKIIELLPWCLFGFDEEFRVNDLVNDCLLASNEPGVFIPLDRLKYGRLKIDRLQFESGSLAEGMSV